MGGHDEPYAAAVASDTAQRLLDLQVRWVLDGLAAEPDAVADAAAAHVESLLALGGTVRVADVVDPEVLVPLLTQVLTVVPPSEGVTDLLDLVADVLHAGPDRTVTPEELIDRADVERLADELHGSTEVVAAALEGLSRSPLVSGLAARFVTKVVTDVVAGNQALARKVPGVGGLLSGGMAMGTSAAGMVLGAGKQLDQLLGDNSSRGAAFVMGRLNLVVVDLLADPATRDAVVEVFDLYADQPLTPLSEHASVDDVRRVLRLAQDVTSGALAAPAAHDLVAALVGAVVDRHRSTTLTEVLADLGLDHDLLVDLARTAVPPALAGLREAGDLEPLVRDLLAPFWEREDVAAVLEHR